MVRQKEKCLKGEVGGEWEWISWYSSGQAAALWLIALHRGHDTQLNELELGPSLHRRHGQDKDSMDLLQHGLVTRLGPSIAVEYILSTSRVFWAIIL